MSKSDYNRAVLLGAVLSAVFLSLFYMVGVAIDVKEPSKKNVKTSNFEIVDTYDGCDIIRWNSHNFAEYKYFMRCKNV